MQFTSRPELPLQKASEKKIEEKAPLAIQYLEKRDAMDIAEMLGLNHLNQPKESH